MCLPYIPTGTWRGSVRGNNRAPYIRAMCRDGSFATGSHANLTRGHVSLGRDRVHVIPVISVTLHSLL